MAKRLPARPDEWIDRSAPLEFQFEGERTAGFAGDVISSALLANGRRVLARSFKYHRPRGVLSLANHDANVLLRSASATNIRADVVAPVAGEQYYAVNTVGGLRFDAMQLLALLGPLLPVGFYYKALYRPRPLFPWWERLIRATAGLGAIDRNAPSWRQSRRHAWCDVLIVGGGVAGLAAAAALADTPLKVMLADENARLGGSHNDLLRHDDTARAQFETARKRIADAPTIECLPAHFAAGCYADHSVPLVGPTGIVNVHARALIFATGVYEQPAVFRNNDLPGVMLTSAASRLVHRYAVAPAEQTCVLAGNTAAYDCALDLNANGLPVAAIVDLDDPTLRGDRAARAQQAGIQVIGQARISEAISHRGELGAVRIRGARNAVEQTLEVDGLLMGVGWAPAAGLLRQAGAVLEYDDTIGQVVPGTLPAGVFAAGRVNGVFAPAARVRDGAAAAAAALAYLGIERDAVAQPPRASESQSHAYPIEAHPRGKEFVDFDEDIQINDLRTAWREGFDSIELLKRYSTIGMGPSQGKTSNMNGVRILARLNEEAVAAVGTTTPRPFTHPVPLGQLAGRRIRHHWHTPMYTYHVAHGGDLQQAGTWLRPMSYVAGSSADAIEREYRTVRDAVGLIDVSTLGKIEIYGPDAEALLDFAYTSSFGKLRTGMTRYIVMVDGSGTLLDDGVAARLATDHFYITTTSANAPVVVRLLHLFVAQLALDVAVLDRTRHVGAMNLAGPRSREVLARVTDLALDDAAMPYLACRSGTVAGVAARLFRVGFVGELGYEIHLPANACATVWQALLSAGEDCAIAPFGVEAQRLLRLEKGHLIFGQDTDGTSNPYEAGLGWAVHAGKPRFNGKHALAVMRDRVARKLVGFRVDLPPTARLYENNLVIDHGAIAGRVTSVAYSPHCGTSIGLAVVNLHLAEAGQELQLRLSDGTMAAATVTATPFYDPDNARQREQST